jgi:fructokinase
MPKRILALGEVLWDLFPDGPRFGGAPANFACTAARLSGEIRVDLVGAVGRDDLGGAARAKLEAAGVGTGFLAEADFPTGHVDVLLDPSGNATYRFLENAAWDHLEWTPEAEHAATRADAVCFGTLGQRSAVSAATIRRLVAATPADCLRVYDINLRPPFWNADVVLQSLSVANVLKLNDDELPELARICDVSGSVEEILRTVRERFALRLVALTRGPNGSILLSEFGELHVLPGRPVAIADTVGAGDAFTAALAVGWIRGLPLKQLHLWASNVAAYVCTRPGGSPEIPAALRA